MIRYPDAPKTLAHHLLLTPMASINILELGSQEEAAIAVLCILSPSPDLLSACPYLAGCTLCVEFESVLSGMVDTGIIFFQPNTYPSANLSVLWIMGGVRCHRLWSPINGCIRASCPGNLWQKEDEACTWKSMDSTQVDRTWGAEASERGTDKGTQLGV